MRNAVVGAVISVVLASAVAAQAPAPVTQEKPEISSASRIIHGSANGAHWHHE